MSDHLIFGENRCSAFCHSCKGFTDRPHVVGSRDQIKKYCAEHCPTCHPPSPDERTGAVAGLVGEQEGLF